MFARDAVDTMQRSQWKIFDSRYIKTTCTTRINTPYTTHIGAEIRSTTDAVDASRDTTAYRYTLDSSSTAGSLPIFVNAQISPSTVTNRVVIVPLSNTAKPAFVNVSDSFAPTNCDTADTISDKPIRNIQSAESALLFSFATSAAAASATA